MHNHTDMCAGGCTGYADGGDVSSSGSSILDNLMAGKPGIPDSTLGDDTSGLQGIANKEALGQLPSENADMDETADQKQEMLLEHMKNSDAMEGDKRSPDLGHAPSDQMDAGFADGGMVTSQTPPDAPELPDDAERKRAPGYDDGGDPSMDLDAPTSDGSDTVKTNGATVPSTATPPPGEMSGMDAMAGAPAALAAPITPQNSPDLIRSDPNNPLAGIPSAPKIPAAPSAPVAPISTPAAPAQAESPNAMDDFFAKQSANMDKYGPDAQNAAEKGLMARERSPLSLISKAVASFSDGIMQGVARAGEGHALDHVNQQWDQLQNNIVDRMKGLNEQEKDSVNSQLALMGKDPNSDLSRAAQTAAAKVTGGNPADFAGMSSADLLPILTAKTTTADTKAKLQLAEQEAMLRHSEAVMNMQAGAAEKTAGTTLGQTIMGKINPNVGAAQQKVAAMAGIGNGAAAAKPGPYGNTTVRNGKTYQWHPDSGKYYLAQ